MSELLHTLHGNKMLGQCDQGARLVYDRMCRKTQTPADATCHTIIASDGKLKKKKRKKNITRIFPFLGLWPLVRPLLAAIL